MKWWAPPRRRARFTQLSSKFMPYGNTEAGCVKQYIEFLLGVWRQLRWGYYACSLGIFLAIFIVTIGMKLYFLRLLDRRD